MQAHAIVYSKYCNLISQLRSKNKYKMLGLRGHPVTAMAACKKLTSLKELRRVIRDAAAISPLGKHVSFRGE